MLCYVGDVSSSLLSFINTVTRDADSLTSLYPKPAPLQTWDRAAM